MADQKIKPWDLPAATLVQADAQVVIGNGLVVQKATPAQIADAGRPIATQSEAMAGTNNTKAMTPQRTKEYVDQYSKFYVNPCLPPFNCVGDGVADDTAGFNAAIDYCTASPDTRVLYIPKKVFRLTSTISRTVNISIVGEGVSPYHGHPEGQVRRGAGSWLYFDHTGRGIELINNSTPAASGSRIERVGFIRNQPTPVTGSAWTPTDNDWDIYLHSVDIKLKDLMHWNSTRGLYAGFGNFGRIQADTIYGQFFKTGYYIDKQYDLPIINNFRQWSWWYDHQSVHDYTMANLETLVIGRCDNPMITNFFSIRHKDGIKIVQTPDEVYNGQTFPGGTCNKGKFVNIDVDRGLRGLTLDGSITTSSPDLDFVNFSCQGEDNLIGSYGVLNNATSSRISMVNLDLRLFDKDCVFIGAGTSTFSATGRVTMIGANALNNGGCGIRLGNGAVANLDGRLDIVSSNGGAQWILSGDAEIYVGALAKNKHQHWDGSRQSATLAAGASFNFPDFSGILYLTEEASGATTQWLCGNGVTKVATSNATTQLTVESAPGVSGYRMRNTGGTSVRVWFFGIVTRNFP